MEFGIHNFGDAFRLLIFIVCVICLVLLAYQFFKRRALWNPKTRDYWFALVMWSVAGVVIGADGLFHDRALNPRTILVTIAALATLNALHRKGKWGADD